MAHCLGDNNVADDIDDDNTAIQPRQTAARTKHAQKAPNTVKSSQCLTTSPVQSANQPADSTNKEVSRREEEEDVVIDDDDDDDASCACCLVLLVCVFILLHCQHE